MVEQVVGTMVGEANHLLKDVVWTDPELEMRQNLKENLKGAIEGHNRREL